MKLKKLGYLRSNKMDLTFFTIERALLLLHRPWIKLPHVPWGVPKLANLIDEMTWLGWGHSRDRVGPDFFRASSSEAHISIGSGWASDILEHTLCISLVAKDSFVGSPPISSNNTKTFPLDFSHERGTWYLQSLYTNVTFKIS